MTRNEGAFIAADVVKKKSQPGPFIYFFSIRAEGWEAELVRQSESRRRVAFMSLRRTSSHRPGWNKRYVCLRTSALSDRFKSPWKGSPAVAGFPLSAALRRHSAPSILLLPRSGIRLLFAASVAPKCNCCRLSQSNILSVCPPLKSFSLDKPQMGSGFWMIKVVLSCCTCRQ